MKLFKNKYFYILIIVIFILYSAVCYINESKRYYKPTVNKIDITPILQKSTLTDDDYKTLYYQTGLSSTPIKEILTDKNYGLQRILKYQADYLTLPNIKCESFIPFLTKEEIITDENGDAKNGFNLAPYKNGYILITKATHTSAFRHGHAAIVIDDKKGITLESLVIGTNSAQQDINKWRQYPSFIMLKPKDMSIEKMNEISKWASDNLQGVPYEITAGIFPKFAASTVLKGTQCSHLAWYPYKYFGYDLDSDGGLIVTAKDIANSYNLEVVQIYGVNPDLIWK